MKIVLIALIVFACVALLEAADGAETRQALVLARPGRTLVMDDFSQAEKSNRRLTRGDWTVKQGVASCVQDDELFKKYNNHGPAVWYDQGFTDGVIRFQFLPSKDCRQFVFTVNGREGHVFRFVMNEMGTNLRAWDADHKGKQLAKDGPPLAHGVWTPVTVELVGQKACVHIGDKYRTVVEDSSYAAPKTVVGVSFHHGSVQLRDFQIVEALPKQSAEAQQARP